MLPQQPNAFGVALLQDPLDFIVDDLRRCLAVRLRGSEHAKAITAQERIFARCQRDRSELLAHAPACNHLARQVRCLLDVVFGARRSPPVHGLFGRATAHRARDPRAQVLLAVIVAIVLRPLVRDAQRLTARHDRYPVDRVCARHEQAKHGVSTFVVRNALSFGGAHHQVARRAEDQLFERVQKVLLRHAIFAAPRCQ